MKTMIRRILPMTLLIFALSICVIPVSAKASTPALKRVNVSWDLKPYTQITYKNAYGGLGLRKEYAKIVKFNRKSVGNRYKITMKVRFECIKTIKNMSRSERNKFLSFRGSDGLLGDYNVVIADYQTGNSLYASNRYGVYADCDYTTYKTEYFYSSDGYYGGGFVNSYATVTITYPKSYKNLCIGVGGSTSYYGATYADDDYYDGYAKFKETSFYSKKDKGVMHFMRVK